MYLLRAPSGRASRGSSLERNSCSVFLVRPEWISSVDSVIAVVKPSFDHRNRDVEGGAGQGLEHVVACGLKRVAKKIVKCTRGWNLSKIGAVTVSSYGLAPPRSPSTLSRFVAYLDSLISSPEIRAASLPGSTVVPFPQDCCQGFFLPADRVSEQKASVDACGNLHLNNI